MELRAGYKQTDVGVIPNDWDLLPISTLTTEFRGGAPLKPTDFTNRGVKVLPKVGVVRTGVLYISEKDIQFCSIAYADAHTRNQVDKAYTVVVLRDLVPSGPSIGLMVEIDTDEIFVLAQGVYGFRVNSTRADARYLIQLSNTSWYRTLANSIMVGSTQVHITNTAFKQIVLPVPAIAEQRAIATALSDVDALLSKLDALIAKKRDLKQAAMQQLLTGKTRLPGFSGEWEVKRLGDLLQMPATYGIVTAGDFQLQGVPMIRGGDIKHGRIIGGLPFVTLAKSKEYSRTIVQSGDVVISLVGYPGEAAVVEAVMEGANISRAVGLLRPLKPLSSLYLASYLNSTQGKANFLTPSAGSAQLVVNLRDLNLLKVPFPHLAEQTAIATVLSDMNTELTALEARREKTRALKQGMMQELLSGRIRLFNKGDKIGSIDC